MVVIAAVGAWLSTDPFSVREGTAAVQSSRLVVGECEVRGVVDGDTFRCAGEGEQRVRILGIDAPETGSSGGRRECHAGTATQRLTDLVGGQTVTLAGDSRQPARDSYGRRLAHVTTLSVDDVGQVLVREGHARTTSFSTYRQNNA